MNPELMRQLRTSVASVVPVPDSVLHLARRAYAWAGDDTPLAAVIQDSAIDQATTARGAGDTRVVELQADGLRLSLEVVAEHGRRAITGHLDPPCPAVVRRRLADGSSEDVGSDDVGRFVLDDVIPGPFSITVSFDERTVATEWMFL
jgi:hypothetical protein